MEVATVQTNLFQDDISLNPTNQVKTHKSFSDCQYDVSINEIKIFLGLISLVKQSDNEFRTFRFSFSGIADFLGFKYSHRCRDVRAIIEKLEEKKVILPEENVPIKERPIIRWLSRCQIAESRDFVELKLNPELADLLLSPDIDSNYIAWQMAIILQMKSTYSVKMYILLKKYAWIRDGKIVNGKNIYEATIAELKSQLGISLNLYPFPANFKAKVLNMAKEECQAYSDIIFDFEPIMQGKATKGYRFIININPNYKSTRIDLKPVSSRTTGMEKLDEIINTAIKEQGFADAVKKLIKHRVSKAGIVEIVTSCTAHEVNSLITELEVSSDIRNIGGAIRAACRSLAQSKNTEYYRLLEEENRKKEELKAEQEIALSKSEAAAQIRQDEEARRMAEINKRLSNLSVSAFNLVIDDCLRNAPEIIKTNFNRSEAFIQGSGSYLKLVTYLLYKEVG